MLHFSGIFNVTRSKRIVYGALIALILVGMFISITHGKWHYEMVIVTLIAFSLFVLLLVRDVTLNNIHYKFNDKLLVKIHKNQSWWSFKQNKDDRDITQVQISATFTNLTKVPIKIIKAQIIKPKIKSAVIHTQVIFPQDNIIDVTPEHYVPAQQTIEVTVNIIIYGKLALSNDRLKITIGVTDQHNIEHRFKSILKPIVKLDSAA